MVSFLLPKNDGGDHDSTTVFESMIEAVKLLGAEGGSGNLGRKKHFEFVRGEFLCESKRKRKRKRKRRG